jgi:cysteine desulfurase
MSSPPRHRGLDGGPVYLDYNATTPVDPRVAEAMRPYVVEHFGNPSSTHYYGEHPRRALLAAREQVANLIGARSGHIVFTASGSEADVLALRGVLVASDRPCPHIVTQATEHPAVLETCRAMERLHGVRLTVLPVGPSGLLAPGQLDAALTDDTVLVSVMAANNETGTLQPVAELASIAHRHGALFHCDAAQAVAKIPVNVSRWEVDLLTVVGHKMYAPKGIGALYVGPDLRLEPSIYGGGQEYGLRAGTENTALAVALGASADLAAAELSVGQPAHLAALRDDLHQRLSQALPGRVHLNGHPTARLPNTLNISIDGIIGNQLLEAVPQIAASTGSACHAGAHTPSPVLTAMGVPPAQALGALRLSLGRWSTSADIATAAEAIAEAAAIRPTPSRTMDHE